MPPNDAEYANIDDQVIDFFTALFLGLFFYPFQTEISGRLKRNRIRRQIEESADAASQSLIRFFNNQELTNSQVAKILEDCVELTASLQLSDVANPNHTPENLIEDLLEQNSLASRSSETVSDSIYRLALYSIIQVVILVGPMISEWRKLKFASTYEVPRRVVNRLNQISRHIDALDTPRQQAIDENYELQYRDFLMQRFHRVEAGTVRMATNLSVDLGELFVMLQVAQRTKLKVIKDAGEEVNMMDLSAARSFFEKTRNRSEDANAEIQNRHSVLQQVLKEKHNVIVGAPGSGKSTFFEWLQLQIASAEQAFVMSDGQQAIPLLLRVRQLDPENLPLGSELIVKATASRDTAALMPSGWIERQLESGRILFMLDGLDETEPHLRDEHIFPWLESLCKRYFRCHFLISSRPVGYPAGLLRDLNFTECDLLDFSDKEILDYVQHWCIAVRLAQNEPETDARREGNRDGQEIVSGFRNHPYIRDLARTPLMLSAICLVNHFEKGQLPEDRARLYQLCVEGLLHNWDQRRGIHSAFGFDEKLHACREVALAMQAADRAECAAEQVKEIFTSVLHSSDRGKKLLEHIRYRTGLLLERRPNVYAFAHLTFQEYLAACAIYQGNRLEIDVKWLVHEHHNARWQEVIALFCGMVPASVARQLLEDLINCADSPSLSLVLAEAFFASGQALRNDKVLQDNVLRRIARSPSKSIRGGPLNMFRDDLVKPIINDYIGVIESEIAPSEAFRWIDSHPNNLDIHTLANRLNLAKDCRPMALCELVILFHRYAPLSVLDGFPIDCSVYKMKGPTVHEEATNFSCQAEVAMLGLSGRTDVANLVTDAIIRKILVSLRELKTDFGPSEFWFAVILFFKKYRRIPYPDEVRLQKQCASAARHLVEIIENPNVPIIRHDQNEAISVLNTWITELNKASSM